MTKEQQKIQAEIEKDLADYLNENPKDCKKVYGFLSQYPAATAKSIVERGFEDVLIRAGRSTHILRSHFGLPHPPCTRIKRFAKKISNEEVQSRVIGIIAKRLSIKDPSIISLDDMLIRDYGTDPLDLIEIQIDIEEKYGIEIPWDEVGGGMDNIGEIVHYVEQRVRRRQKPNQMEKPYSLERALQI